MLPTAIALLALTSISIVSWVGAPAGQKVNPKLLAHHNLYKAGLVAIGETVHADFAFGYSNLGYIEGDDGIAV